MRYAGRMVLLAATLLLPREVLTQDSTGLVLRPVASLTSYLISNSHPFFGAGQREWAEFSVSAGGRVTARRVAVELVGLAVRTLGRDPYGTGGAPVAGTESTGVDRLSSWGLGVDRASIAFMPSAGLPLTISIGRQRIEIGSQFLIGDGVYDGFARGVEHAVYHNPRKSFDAVRVQWDIVGARADAFGYLVHPTWDAAGGRDGRVVGLDFSRTFARTGSRAGFGIFGRSSRSNLDNDMALLNLRLDQRLGVVPGLRASGEMVLERGRCHNAYYCATPGERMDERSWHAELRWEDTTTVHRPMVEGGMVYYSADFTPLAPGASDWGQWYLGNQIDWISFGSNTRVVRAQAGGWVDDAVRIRVQYHHTRQVLPTGTSSGGPLSDEATLIGEWYPNGRTWINLVLGYAKSGRALAASGLGNPFSGLNSNAVAVGEHPSFDVILATGITF